MVYRCKVCGKELSTKKGLTSWQHLHSKQHLKALGQYEDLSQAPSLKKKRTQEFSQILLFIALKELKDPTFTNLLTFLESFGIKTQTIINICIKKIKDGDLIIQTSLDEKIAQLNDFFFEYHPIDYPFTMELLDFYKNKQLFGWNTPEQVPKFVEEVNNDHPGFITMSPSNPGEPADLVTFNKIFEDNTKFSVRKRWAL